MAGREALGVGGGVGLVDRGQQLGAGPRPATAQKSSQ
jgi:hypothetical protein